MAIVSKRIIGIPGGKFPKELRAKLSEAQKGKFGEKSSRWKGGRRIIEGGYVIRTVDGKEVREHRLVMSLAIGRNLLHDEVVHHKNGNSSDNRLENLQLMTRASHTRLHYEILSAEGRERSRQHKIGRRPTQETKEKMRQARRIFWERKRECLGN